LKKISLFLLFIILITACGRTATPVPEIVSLNPIIDLDDISAIQASPDPVGPSAEVFTITWDVYSPNRFNAATRAENGPAALALNERFNVTMTSIRERGIGQNYIAWFQELLQSGNGPDIFFANRAGDVFETIEAGYVRSIPWEMIEKHMPRYMAFLREDPGLLDMLKNNDLLSNENETWFLYGLERGLDMLETFSVYRLDRLEEIGITPHATVTEIMDRIFFTESAFHFNEFTEIMKQFSELDEDIFGFVINDTIWSAFNSRPLLGMFGGNTNFVNENGRPMLWFASESYRSYLEFMLTLLEAESIFMINEGSQGQWQIGMESWWNGTVSRLFGENSLTHNILFLQPNAKIIITPPEIGPSGLQGACQPTAGGATQARRTFMINAAVSDEKLARILEIFDHISFDPELWVLVNYGTEGEDFYWTGEPYNSGIKAESIIWNHVGVFSTYFMDDNAGKFIYNYPSNELYAFASSREAGQMIILPYGNHNLQDIEEGVAAWNEIYDENLLFETANEYFRAVMKREKDLHSSWQDYIDDLNVMGLAALNAVYSN
jgi:ABC-type glycerol-3-phosphate transport system substrate-binding protein